MAGRNDLVQPHYLTDDGVQTRMGVVTRPRLGGQLVAMLDQGPWTPEPLTSLASHPPLVRTGPHPLGAEQLL